MRIRLYAAALLACFVVAETAAQEPVPLRRYALVAASNDGGPQRVRLKYAESDARAFAAVIEELGGVRSDDLVLAVNPNPARLEAAFSRVREMIAEPRSGEERRELLVYYSGHSDDQGLILGGQRFPWEDLRGRINDIPADVKVAILDSCSSGSLTRAKGGVPQPAFLFDASSDMKGHAYLTSSSAEEAAQESDRIGASFFTHFLISGLRGAADTAGDGVVTLNEAYAFAFHETLASTEKTEYGPQHPAYDISLTGSGDLVLTDLRAASAKLDIAEDVEGHLYIRDSRGVLAVELNKVKGEPVELGLTPGFYKVVLDGPSGRLGTQIRISARQQVILSRSSLRRVPVDRTIARGSRPADDPVSAGAAFGASVGAVVGEAVATAITTTVEAVAGGRRAPEGQAVPVEDAEAAPPASPAPTTAAPGPRAVQQRAPSSDVFHVSLLPEISSGLFASQDNHVVSINLLVGTSFSVRGFEAGALGNFESADMAGFQAAGLANVVLGGASGFQTAGLGNVAGGDSRVLQTAGLFNVSAGPMRGAQVAGLFNWAGDELWGAQVSGLANRGVRVNGPQISVVNIAGTVSGAQIGVVNIAGHVNGVQIGVVNISREIDGVPIGLVSIEERGRQAVDVWYDTDGALNGALSFGSRYFYTILSAGWIPDSRPALWSVGLGIGARAPLGSLWADFDICAVQDQDSFDDPAGPRLWDVHPRLRAVLGIPVAGRMAVEAGVAVTMSFPDGTTSTEIRYSPAFFVGIQL